MPQSLVLNLHHTVFSTKNRIRMIGDEWSEELYRYIGGNMNRIGCKLIEAGGTSDHIHLLSSIDKKVSLPELVNRVKSSSSYWIHQRIPGMKKFCWQRGYASFSVSASQENLVIRYIQNQDKHHTRYGFQKELLRLLHSHGLKYDERYLWN
jgi:REP-associated tyrosine transposase